MPVGLGVPYQSVSYVQSWYRSTNPTECGTSMVIVTASGCWRVVPTFATVAVSGHRSPALTAWTPGCPVHWAAYAVRSTPAGATVKSAVVLLSAGLASGSVDVTEAVTEPAPPTVLGCRPTPSMYSAS